MEGDEEMLEANDGNNSLMSGYTGLSKTSVGSFSKIGGASLGGSLMGASMITSSKGGEGLGGTSNSAMSVTSMSTSGSSGKWASLLRDGGGDDEHTLGAMSAMSADIIALDLASSCSPNSCLLYTSPSPRD